MYKEMLKYPFDGKAIVKNKKKIKKELLSEKGQRMQKRIAVLGGSTTDDVVRILDLFLLNYGIEGKFYESEYNMFYQDALFAPKELVEFEPEIIYIHTSWRNIQRFPDMDMSEEEIDCLLQEEYGRFEETWKALQDKYSCVIIQNNFERPYYRLMGNRDIYDRHGMSNFIYRMNGLFYKYANEHGNFYINDIEYLAARWGTDEWSDPFYWHMYKYSMRVEAIPDLAVNIANIIKSLCGKNKKGIVLDLDNTLWGGIVGDDGAEKIEIGQESAEGQAYALFQEYIKAHKKLGIVLAVDSKNDEKNALAGLGVPGSVLTPEDFAVIKANWDPKDKNMFEIADELSLLPESFVFIDDNPVEREIIKMSIPDAGIPEISKAEYYIREIDHMGYFECTSISGEDTKRSRMYAENAKRARAREGFADYREYLLSLEMKAQIKEFVPENYLRVEQLSNKSNQFNLTTLRLSADDVRRMAEDKTYITLSGRLKDRFGDNGIVSLAIGRLDGKRCDIILWLMSCRVLKRDMEFAMMDEFVGKCKDNGIEKVVGHYYPTAKNGMVTDFYEKQGFECISRENDGSTEWQVFTSAYEKKNKVIEIDK